MGAKPPQMDNEIRTIDANFPGVRQVINISEIRTGVSQSIGLVSMPILCRRGQNE